MNKTGKAKPPQEKLRGRFYYRGTVKAVATAGAAYRLPVDEDPGQEVSQAEGQGKATDDSHDQNAIPVAPGDFRDELGDDDQGQAQAQGDDGDPQGKGLGAGVHLEELFVGQFDALFQGGSLKADDFFHDLLFPDMIEDEPDQDQDDADGDQGHGILLRFMIISFHPSGRSRSRFCFSRPSETFRPRRRLIF